MDNYLYSMYGNPRDGIIIYRVDKNQGYAKSTDFGETYVTITEEEIPEVTLGRLTTTHTKRWITIPTKKTFTRIPRKNNDDVGITKTTFIEHVLRIYGPFVEYNTGLDKFYTVTYDITNTKQLIPFKRSILIELANNYRYYGTLPGDV